MAALQDDDVVHLPALKTMAPLWTKFDDQFQDDASHFLQELVGMAQTNGVIQSYHHVDFRQEVHQRQAFPQVGRYSQVEGVWTKHHRGLQVPSIFNLPVIRAALSVNRVEA